jgi:hypothetical protein
MSLYRCVISATLLVAFLAVSGCGGGNKEPSKLEQLQQTAKAMEETAKQMEKVQSGEQKPVPPVSFKVLLTFLPKAVGDLKAGEPEGETQNMGEWNFSNAKIEFNGEGGKQANVEVFDYAHIGIMYAPYTILLNMKFSRESTKGYEKSTKLGDFPAYEKWENADARNEITVLVADRFIVTVKTDKLGEGSARKIAEGMDLKKLSTQTAS